MADVVSCNDRESLPGRVRCAVVAGGRALRLMQRQAIRHANLQICENNAYTVKMWLFFLCDSWPGAAFQWVQQHHGVCPTAAVTSDACVLQGD